MSLQKSFALLLAACFSHLIFAHAVWGKDRPEPSSLVSVRMNADFHPELEFRIAEALRRPPLEWSVPRDHTFAEVSEPLGAENHVEAIIARWDDLWTNNPAHPIDSAKTAAFVASATGLAEIGKRIQVFMEKNFTFLAGDAVDFPLGLPPADLISLNDLPQVHTGEEIMAEMKVEYAHFPLDPYGYDEYNGYFEPEVYDWFVFVTDDLTIVYVHENSDVMPLRLANEDLDPTMPPSELTEWPGFAVRESVRAVLVGEIGFSDLVDQTCTAWSAATKPIWTRYVTQNELLRIERVAQLRELLRL